MTDRTEDIRFVVNGGEVVIHARPDEKLLYVLRNDLNLKGTRFGCGAGDCGACMVMIDGRAVNSCDTPLWTAANKSVTTVEGVGVADGMPALISAFVTEQAAQCGYCASGIIVSAAALLRRNPTPDETEVRTALDNNLCRCGSHLRMVRAVLAAAKEMANG